MQLTGILKEKVEKAENREEALEIIKEAGMILSDEELNQACGGAQVILKGGLSNRE